MRRDEVRPGGLQSRTPYGDSLVYLEKLQVYDRGQRRIDRRRAVDNIFPESFMVALSLLLIPILVLPLAVELPGAVTDILEILNYAIILLFALEYALKLVVSEDPRRYASDPWHILDLFIVVATLIALAVGLQPNAGGLPLLLRLLRLPAAVSLGGRTIHRRGIREEEEVVSGERPPPREAILLLSSPEKGWMEQGLPHDPEVHCGAKGQWHHITGATERDIPTIGRESGLSSLVLEGKMKEWAYPRAEMAEGNATIFLRIPEAYHGARFSSTWLMRWDGLLLIDCQGAPVTLSRRDVPEVYTIPDKARQAGLELRPSTILFLLLRDSLSTIEDFILAVEMELFRLETIPMADQPRVFLPVAYSDKKEVGHVVLWLLHTVAVIEGILGGRVAMHDWEEERDRPLYQTSLERCEFLLETAESVAEGLSDAIDFYLDTTSYQTNRVMKVIAVLTALTVIPTVVGGMLGMNLVGNPWNVSLAQIVTVVAVVMASTAWIYYRLGWFRL